MEDDLKTNGRRLQQNNGRQPQKKVRQTKKMKDDLKHN